jgi:phosphoribosylglycinamide formyltransferase-1
LADLNQIAVLISGSGSNLQALIDACETGEINAQISCVISNEPDVYGLERAKKAQIPTNCINHRDFETREDFEQALIRTLSSYHVDLICLAGFMRILTPHFISSYDGQILNIHPSLLPKYKGLNTHQRAIDAGDREAGCSVHEVIADLDAGEILVQKSVPILDGDTVKTLSERVLEQEHIAYPEAVKIWIEKSS